MVQVGISHLSLIGPGAVYLGLFELINIFNYIKNISLWYNTGDMARRVTLGNNSGKLGKTCH